MTTFEKSTQAYLSAFATLFASTFLSTLAPKESTVITPPPPPKSPTAFAEHIAGLKDALTGFTVTAPEICINEEKGEVTVGVTSEAHFHKEIVGRIDTGI